MLTDTGSSSVSINNYKVNNMIDQKCIITITGKKETPEETNVKFEFKPKFDMGNESNNHQGVIGMFADILQKLKENNTSCVQDIDL